MVAVTGVEPVISWLWAKNDFPFHSTAILWEWTKAIKFIPLRLLIFRRWLSKPYVIDRQGRYPYFSLIGILNILHIFFSVKYKMIFFSLFSWTIIFLLYNYWCIRFLHFIFSLYITTSIVQKLTLGIGNLHYDIAQFISTYTFSPSIKPLYFYISEHIILTSDSLHNKSGVFFYAIFLVFKIFAIIFLLYFLSQDIICLVSGYFFSRSNYFIVFLLNCARKRCMPCLTVF